MLVILKNQPARQAIAEMMSPATTARKLAESDLQLAHQSAATEAFRLKSAMQLKSALLAQTREAAAQIQAVVGPQQDFIAARLIGARKSRRAARVLPEFQIKPSDFPSRPTPH